MANVKISELPVATSLNGADSFPVVQGGVTKQAARSVLFASPTFTGTTTADILTATGDVSFDGGSFVFNDSGADKDARFEGDTDANLLFLDASTNRVGIGTNTPAAKLDVNGNTSVTGNVTLAGDVVLANDRYLYWGAGDGSAYVRGNSSSDYVSFGTVGVERMRLDSFGNLGIGTTNPQQKLVVSNAGAQGFEISPDAVASAPAVVAYDRNAGAYIRLSSLALEHVWQAGAPPAEAMRLDSSGNLIYRVNGTAPSLTTNSTMSFELTSNTSLKIVVRGTDGVTRSVSLTLS